MKIDNKQAEYRYYSNIDSAWAGKTIRAYDVPESNRDDVGYTYGKGAVYVNYLHPIMNGLSEEEKQIFRFGVNVHELLHILFSNFLLLNKVINSLPESEKPFFLEISNIMEDPAIEFWGMQEFGGNMLEALRFSIAHIYKKAKRIEEYPDGFSQFVTACIHFGDMGSLKGFFTDPLAKKIFEEAAPIIDSCIEEPDAGKRLELSKEVFELSRPLWQTAADLEKIKRQLAEILRAHGKNGKKEQGQAILKPSRRNDGNSSDNYDRLTARRKSLLGRIEDAKMEEEQQQEKSGFGSSSKKSSSIEEYTGQTCKLPDVDTTSDIEIGEIPEIEVFQTDYQIPESLIESIKRGIEDEKKFMESANDKVVDDDTPALAPILSSPLWQGKIICENQIVKLPEHNASSEETYSIFRTKLDFVIKVLHNQLKRIFIQDADEKVYRSSGRVDMKRLYSGMATAKLFYKKKDPAEKDDMVIAILFDCSTSMSGDKIDSVREMLIVMSEVFGKFDIPIYLLGYSEGAGGKVLHRHYIRWNNSARERLKLVGLNTNGCNFDGYSIRYITEILKKKNAKHKLLITLSDGAPFSEHYKEGTSNAINDTRNAVNEAKKIASVLGVAIGDSHLNEIKVIYGKDFLHITNVSDITTSLAKSIKKIVSKWE